MSIIKQSRQVNHSANQMYDLVNDVLSYSKFLPDCITSQVIYCSDTKQEAIIEVTKLGLTYCLSTSNTMIPNKEININLLYGPFKKFIGKWQFIAINKTLCLVKFELIFESMNPLIDFAFNGLLDEIISEQIQAFIQRADEVYCG